MKEKFSSQSGGPSHLHQHFSPLCLGPDERCFSAENSPVSTDRSFGVKTKPSSHMGPIWI